MPTYSTTKVDDNGRVCTECKAYKPWSEYNFNKGTRTGYFSKCRNCQAKLRNESRIRNQCFIGITQLIEILESQNNKCKICDRDLEFRASGINKVCIDHSHKTGKLRGLLCTKCNSVLGFCDDNRDVLKKAIIYLEENN